MYMISFKDFVSAVSVFHSPDLTDFRDAILPENEEKARKDNPHCQREAEETPCSAIHQNTR